MIVAGGLWVAFTTWRARLPKMHILSLGIILVGLGLIAAEVLPRTGYASVDPKNPPQLWCPETEPAQPLTTPDPKAALPATDPHAGVNLSSTCGATRPLLQTNHGSRWREHRDSQATPSAQAALQRIAHPGLRSSGSCYAPESRAYERMDSELNLVQKSASASLSTADLFAHHWHSALASSFRQDRRLHQSSGGPRDPGN